MKYFERFLARPNKPGSEDAEDDVDDVDISVHCDIAVFDWLVKFMRSPRAAVLTVRILRSRNTKPTTWTILQ